MTKEKTGWRYQAVYIERDIDGQKSLKLSICEVYIASKGKLAAWTEISKMEIYGETVDELINNLQGAIDDVSKWRFLGETVDEVISDLQDAIDDLRKWKPVPFFSLGANMVFEPTEYYAQQIEDKTIEINDDDDIDGIFAELTSILESYRKRAKSSVIMWFSSHRQDEKIINRDKNI